MRLSAETNHLLREMASLHGPSFYVLWDERLSSNFRRLNSAFRSEYPRTKIAYSYKTNYLPALCKALHKAGALAEVVSDMEWQMARLYGVPPSMVVYNGPNKSESSFSSALMSGALVQVDNRRDWKMLKALRDQDLAVAFGIRVNFRLKASEDSRFGIDVEGELFQEILSDVKNDDRLVLRGLHCHFPDRDVESFRTRIDRLIAISDKAFLDESPEYLNVGGGLGGELAPEVAQRLHVPAVSYSEYAGVVGGRMREKFGTGDRSPELIIEPGTAIAADAMSFATTVIDIREIRGRRIAVVDGSLFNVSPHSRSRNLPMRVVSQRDAASTVECDVAGFTCIESDVITLDAPLDLRVGDLVLYDNVGSYSVVMKPPFILPSPPILRVTSDSKVELVRRRETVDDILATYRGV